MRCMRGEKLQDCCGPKESVAAARAAAAAAAETAAAAAAAATAAGAAAAACSTVDPLRGCIGTHIQMGAAAQHHNPNAGTRHAKKAIKTKTGTQHTSGI